MNKLLKRIAAFFAVILILGAGVGYGKKGFGTGDGSGKGVMDLVEIDPLEKESNFKEDVIINIEEKVITIDDVECSNIDNLNDIISGYETEKNKRRYILSYEYGIKSVVDEVKADLNILKEILEIEVIDEDNSEE